MTEPTTRQIDPRRAVRIGRGILVTSSLLFCCLFFGCAEEQEGIRAGARDLVVTKGTTESFVAGRAVPGLARPAGKSEGGEAEPNRDLLRFYDPATDRFPSGIRHRELRYVSTLADRAPDATQALAGKQQVANIDLGAWRSLGPDQNGGRTRAFGIDIEGRYMVSGCVSGGLFRMENENDSIWVKRSSPEANQSVTALAQDQREGYRQNWYYATGEVRGAAGRGPVGTNAMGSGLYRSTDSARSWEPILSTQPNGPADFDSPFEAAWRMVVDHTAEGPGTLYVACYGGIMRSDNAGETWQMVLGAEVGPRALSTDIVITSDGVLYAALSNYGYNGSGGVWNSLRSGIWRSEDGLSWHRLDAPLPDGHGYFRSVLATAPSDSTVLYLMAYAENPQTGAKADIAIKLYGDDLDVLKEKADEKAV